MLYDLLKEHNLTKKILAFTDNNPMKFGRSYCEEKIHIENPECLIERYGNKLEILIASSAYDVIRKQMKGYGFSDNKIFLFNFAFMDVKYTDCSFIYDHIDDFERAYEKMSDDKSKRIFLNILNYRITKDQKYLEQMQSDVDDEHYQYFDENLFEKISDEVFLDIGAYTGDTFAVYTEIYKNWKEYVAFEADSEVYKNLERTINNMGFLYKTKLFNVATWSENTKLIFSENPGSSTITQREDGISVEAVVTDEVIGEEPITFIKMDIEGAEYNALLGMKKIIQKRKPVLAICVYHKREDFYKLTDFVEEIAPKEYSFYFRQYRYTPTETVCYAVPRKRVVH